MKKLFLIIISILFLTGSTELHELLRIPHLLKHYSQHRSSDSSISLVDFLITHYSENHPADNDEGDDSQLPFKSKESLAHIDTATPIIKDDEDKQVFPPGKNIVIQFAEEIPDKKSFSVFRPPRLI